MRFPQPRQDKVISANSKGIVYEMRINGGMVGLIDSIGNNMFSDAFLIFKVDGEPVFDKVDSQIGAINDPKILKRPMVARKKIEWIAVNNSDEEVNFEVITDGDLLPESQVF